MKKKRYITKISMLSASILLAVSALFGFAFTSPVLAAPYGCGTYGSESYQANCPAPSATPSSSGGTGTPTIEAPAGDNTVIILNTYEDFFNDTGITVTNLEVGDVLGFCIDTGTVGCSATEADFYSATIKSIDLSDSDNPILTITFAPTPFDVDFKKGETKKFDLDKDGTEDVEVTFVDFVDGHAIVTMKKINPSSTNTTAPNKTARNTTTTDESEASQSTVWLWIIGVGATLCAIIAIVIVLRHRNRTRTVTW